MPNAGAAELNKKGNLLSSSVNSFWKVWRKEYVLLLRQNQQKRTLYKEPSIKVHDIVIIFDEKLPRQLWKLGRIVELITGADKVVRGAKVKLGQSGCVISRPLNKLYPIEVNGGDYDIANEKDIDSPNIIEDNVDNKLPDIERSELLGDKNISPEGDDEDIDKSDDVRYSRPRRHAAVLADIKRRDICD